MNCNTCRFELSQCLDGRLPSGRRAVVMQHTASCEVCATFWNEIQAAQKLTLQLPRERVADAFRDQLWQRIRAGEGTPDAVFREPVPTLLKVRYAFTGAAAAAAVLLFGLWLRNDPGAVNVAPTNETDMAVVSKEQPRSPNYPSPNYPSANVIPEDADSAPGAGTMWNATQPLTANLVALETARQLESRYQSVDLSLRQLDSQARQAKESNDSTTIVERILRDATEMRVFAEVLLEMRDHERVSFPDPEVGADLRFVTNMLMPRQLRERNLQTVSEFVAPTVRESRRLGRISRHILVSPSVDPHEEAATLIRLNSTRPEVFTQLFIVLGQADEMSQEFGLFRRNRVFFFQDVCGSNFVTPRSQLGAQARIR